MSQCLICFFFCLLLVFVFEHGANSKGTLGWEMVQAVGAEECQHGPVHRELLRDPVALALN